MTVSTADFSRLKWHLLIFLSALIAGGTAIIASKNFVVQVQREQQVAQRQLATSRSQLAGAEEDRKNMQAFMFEYDELLRRNIIGDGQRLDWVEGLESIRQQHRMLNFRYTISPQHSYTRHQTLGKPLDSGDFELNMSDMSLQFDLLHEEQLINFFDALRTGTNGWFILDHCTLERNEPDSTSPLKAECSGGWLTLKSRNAK